MQVSKWSTKSACTFGLIEEKNNHDKRLKFSVCNKMKVYSICILKGNKKIQTVEQNCFKESKKKKKEKSKEKRIMEETNAC